MKSFTFFTTILSVQIILINRTLRRHGAMLETTTRGETRQGVHLYLVASQEETLRAALQAAAAAVDREPRTLRPAAQPGALEAAAAQHQALHQGVLPTSQKAQPLPNLHKDM